MRRAAAARGKKGILVLVDEAQLFFPPTSGMALGDKIKDLLERHWSINRNDLAPLMFGFIGLPTLQARAGGNLCGLLRPEAVNELKEGELNQLIKSVTNNALNTTREARWRLARTAGNIYVLRTLVNRLAEHVQKDGRAWASYDDVFRIETVLRAYLREGQEKQVSGYLRDSLNDAEAVNEWKPSAAIPLAVALAEAHHSKVPAHKLYEEARARLDAWYAAIGTSESTKLSYDAQQFKEHLHTLEERGIVINREFTSCLLQDWLLGFTKQVDDEEWRGLLKSAAIKRIRIPVSLQKVPDVEGGEANVFTWNRDHEKFALRRNYLHTEQDKERFNETRELLERLKSLTKDGVGGAQYIFRLEEVGLSAENDSEAIQVYRWVEGTDLSRRIGQLPAAYVSDIGAKLAEALQLLHASNIVHRDLSPRNVVVADEGGDPIIIDFGFARRLTPDVKTTIDSDYSAPEVRRMNPKWTKAADIFSLGATLSRVLGPAEDCGCLREVIQACQKEDSEERPDARTLTCMFDNAAKELHVDALKTQTWEKVRTACGADYDNVSWFRGIVDKFKGNFFGVALGCLPNQFDRCREAANFLNQVLEASSVKRKDQLSLGKVKEDNIATGKELATESVRFMHMSRKYDSHGEYWNKSSVTARFNCSDEQRMQSMALDAASQIGGYLGLKSLAEVVSLLIL